MFSTKNTEHNNIRDNKEDTNLENKPSKRDIKIIKNNHIVIKNKDIKTNLKTHWTPATTF